MVNENPDVIFDRILYSIGDNGKFQKRFVCVFILLLTICASMVYMNLILAMTIPDHWCYVPGRDNTTYSLEEWKSIHLPREMNPRGQLTHSSCQMYNLTAKHIGNKPNETIIVKCQHGYEYDDTWYTSTIPSSQNWVCDDELLATNALAIGRFAEVVGTLVLGTLGDYIGRRPICLIAMLLAVSGKIFSICSVHIYYAFLVGCFVASLPSISVLQAVLVIAMEISQPERRASLAQYQSVGWCFSLILMSLVCWAIPDWKIFLLITTAPLGLFIFAYGFITESPRWLASRGKIEECLREMNKIAKVNGTTFDPELKKLLQDTTREPEKVYGIMSTMSSWRLAKNTFISVMSWITCGMCYFVIILNTANLGGNPFLNFLWQSAIELPSYFVGKYLADKIGRRFSGFLSFFLTMATLIPVICIVRDGSSTTAIICLMIVAKFFFSISFYTITLQCMEIYPTCLRQTGMSFGISMSCASGTVGPYIVYLGTAIDARYPYVIMAILCFVGAIMQVFLPETLHVKLPETLQEARLFGKDQKFFSHLPKKPKSILISEEIKLCNN